MEQLNTRAEKIKFLKDSIINIADFPKAGIQFKDVTPLFEKDTLPVLSEVLIDQYKGKGITKVVGLESRGFFMAPILALNIGAGFIPVRKPGKLPRPVFEESYSKEYGTDIIQIHQDSLSSNDVVLLHDDLLATGGTMLAAYNLVKKMNVKKIYINFIVELEDLNGRQLFPSEIDLQSLINFPL